ncbi:MAG TPA: hypothetical protein VK906_01475 [Egicoccus sp.]|nr:hypothetical protein [Egicoccus sp.]HSK21810.1 hypothetical protein [Egicoccus sp.]
MPEITELLERAAPGGAGPAPLDDIVRRGRRRQAMVRTAAVGAPLAAVVVVVAVLVTGGSPTGVVIDPPPMAETPDPTPTPSAEPTEPTAPEQDSAPDPVAAGEVGNVPLGDLGVEAFVVAPAESAFGDVVPRVDRHRPESTTLPLDIEAGFPGATGLVPDSQGGFAWQPDWQSAEPAPVLHRDRRGEVRTLFEADVDQTLRLVGPHDATRAVLVSVGSGSDFESATADLVSVPFDGGAPEVVVEGIGAWEQGVKHAAAAGDTVLYAEWVEAMERVVVRAAGSEPVVVFEGGELTGEYVRGVGISAADDLGLVLVTGTADDGRPTARLISIHLSAGEVIGESPVPLDDAAIDGFAPVRATDLSVTDRYILVSREFEGEAAPAVVYDIAKRGWATIRAGDGTELAGRTFLAPAADAGGTSQAACVTDEADLRNAEPETGRSWWYLPCRDSPRAGDVYRLPVDVAPTGDVEADLAAVLEALIDPVVDDALAERGYYTPADRGQPVLRSVSFDGSQAVVDLGFPNGVGNLSTSYAAAMWHSALSGTIFQFPAIDSVEFRLDGSCEGYAAAFEGVECQIFDRSMAPWNGGVFRQ